MTEMTRDELREEIERVYQNSLMRRGWGFIGRGLARSVGRKGEAPLWVSLMVAMSIVQIATQILLAVLKEPVVTSPVSIQFSYPMLTYLWFCGVVFQILIDRFIKQIKTTVVDALDLPASEPAIKAWLQFVDRRSNQWVTMILVLALFASTTIFVFVRQGLTPTISVYLFNILVFMLISPHIFWIFIIAFTFAFSIRDWKFQLFQDDPSRTYVIQALHQISSNVLLAIASLMALNLILVIPLNLYSQIYLIISTSIFWIPALLYFVLTEGSFSHLIREAKLKRQAVIQKQIMEIENTQNMSQKEPAEAVQRLLDLHDRVKTTPVSVINLNSIANLLGSLALPLLAVLINIFDIWQKLFPAP